MNGLAKMKLPVLEWASIEWGNDHNHQFIDGSSLLKWESRNFKSLCRCGVMKGLRVEGE